MAVVWLYERVKNGEFENGIFKEKDIHRAFEEVSFIDPDRIRLSWTTYNGYIMELQEFYLIYKDEDQTYMFTDFGFQMCDKIHRLMLNRGLSNFYSSRKESPFVLFPPTYHSSILFSQAIRGIIK